MALRTPVYYNYDDTIYPKYQPAKATCIQCGLTTIIHLQDYQENIVTECNSFSCSKCGETKHLVIKTQNKHNALDAIIDEIIDERIQDGET